MKSVNDTTEISTIASFETPPFAQTTALTALFFFFKLLNLCKTVAVIKPVCKTSHHKHKSIIQKIRHIRNKIKSRTIYFENPRKSAENSPEKVPLEMANITEGVAIKIFANAEINIIGNIFRYPK